MKRILTVAALLLIVALALTACGGSDEKEETVYDILADAIEKTIDVQVGESTDVWEQALKSGSLEQSYQFGDNIIPIKTLTEKSYFGKDSSSAFMSIGLTNGQTFDLSAFGSKEKIIFTCSAFLETYGFTSEGLADMILSQSVPNSQDQKATTEFSEKITKIVEKMEDDLYDIIEYYLPLTMKKAESSLNFSFMLSGSSIHGMLSDGIDLCANNSEFCKAILNYSEDIGEPMTKEQLNDEFDEAKRELNDLDSYPYVMSFSITCTNDRIIKNASFNVTDNASSSGFLSAGNSLAKVWITLSENGGFSAEVTVEDDTFTVSRTVTDYGTTRKESLSIGAKSISVTPLTLTYNTENGDYTLKVEIPGTFSGTVKGNYSSTKTEAVLTITSFTMDLAMDDDYFATDATETINIPFQATITAKTKDTSPKAPSKYTDITELNEVELSMIEESLANDPVIKEMIKVFKEVFDDNTWDEPSWDDDYDDGYYDDDYYDDDYDYDYDWDY